MLNGKGFAFAAVGAVVAAALWVVLIQLSGWSLWLLAPAIGGAAGYGMMRGTQMRGGVPAGVAAAACTVVAIVGARWFVVSGTVEESVEAAALTHVEDIVAADMGEEEVWTEDGRYSPLVENKAREAWSQFTQAERAEVMAAVRQESGLSSGGMMGLGVAFDLGIFGLICSGLAAGTAFKTGGMTLEKALVDKGFADAQTASEVANKMREEDAAKPGWRLPGPAGAPTPTAGASPVQGEQKKSDAA